MGCYLVFVSHLSVLGLSNPAAPLIPGALLAPTLLFLVPQQLR